MYRKKRILLTTLAVLFVAAVSPRLSSAQANDDQTAAPADAVPAMTDSLKHFASDIGFDFLLEQNDPLDWLILLGSILAGLVVGKVVAVMLVRASRKRAESGHPSQATLLEGVSGPLNLLFVTVGLWVGFVRLSMHAGIASFASDLLTLLVYIAFFWWTFNLVATAETGLRKLTNKSAGKLDDMLVPLVRKALRVFIVIVGFLLIAENVFGQDVGAWLAGLGIAGLAVSFAAQDSLKNFFGSLTILFDRPFRVGDRINFAGYDGPVEEIGFRSTKIRTLTGHLVTVPNSKVVNEAVEDIAVRPSIRRLFHVKITYDTPPEKIELAVETIRAVLEEEDIAEPIHGSIGPDSFPPRVYFNDLNADSLNIMVIYWFFPPAYWDFLEHAQLVNLRLMREFDRIGVDFAFPTQTVHLAGDGTKAPGLEPADEPPDGEEKAAPGSRSV